MTPKKKKRLTPKKVGVGDPTFILEFLIPDSDTVENYPLQITAQINGATVFDMTSNIPLEKNILAMSSFVSGRVQPNASNLLDVQTILEFESDEYEFEVNNGTGLPHSDDVMIDTITFDQISFYTPTAVIFGQNQEVALQCRQGAEINTFLSNRNNLPFTEPQFISCNSLQVWALNQVQYAGMQNVFTISSVDVATGNTIYLGVNTSNQLIFSTTPQGAIPPEMLWQFVTAPSNPSLYNILNVSDFNNPNQNDMYLQANTSSGNGAVSMTSTPVDWFVHILP